MNLDVVVDELLRWEGFAPWMYLDTRGNVTVGIGMLVKDAEAAISLPFLDSRGRYAHREDIRADFDRVAAMAPGQTARHYTCASAVELAAATVRSLAVERLNVEFLPGIRRLLPTFSEMPESAQLALFDLAWNLGIAGLSKFGNLLACCRSQNWTVAALECVVYSSRPERNAWRTAQFNACAVAA